MAGAKYSFEFKTYFEEPTLENMEDGDTVLYNGKFYQRVGDMILIPEYTSYHYRNGDLISSEMLKAKQSKEQTDNITSNVIQPKCINTPEESDKNN